MSRSGSIESLPLCLSAFNPSASFPLPRQAILLCALIFQNYCTSRSIPPRSPSVSWVNRAVFLFFLFSCFTSESRPTTPIYCLWGHRVIISGHQDLWEETKESWGSPSPRERKNRQCLNKVTTLRHHSSIQFCSKTPYSALNSKPTLAERVEEAATLNLLSDWLIVGGGFLWLALSGPPTVEGGGRFITLESAYWERDISVWWKCHVIGSILYFTSREELEMLSLIYSVRRKNVGVYLLSKQIGRAPEVGCISF